MAESIRIMDLLFYKLPDNYLVKTNRASMHFSLEIRSPYLDHRFFELSQTLPTKWKQTILKRKILMRKIIKDIIPKKIYKRKDKRGFTPPLREWLKEDKNFHKCEEILTYLKVIVPDFVEFY
ncbi:MAG: asparagine synthase-related protein [Promethearchaeota archaeon]